MELLGRICTAWALFLCTIIPLLHRLDPRALIWAAVRRLDAASVSYL